MNPVLHNTGVSGEEESFHVSGEEESYLTDYEGSDSEEYVRTTEWLKNFTMGENLFDELENKGFESSGEVRGWLDLQVRNLSSFLPQATPREE